AALEVVVRAPGKALDLEPEAPLARRHLLQRPQPGRDHLHADSVSGDGCYPVGAHGGGHPDKEGAPVQAVRRMRASATEAGGGKMRSLLNPHWNREEVARHATSAARAVIQHQNGEEDRQVPKREEELVARPPLARVRAQPPDAVPEEQEARDKRGREVEAPTDAQRD